MPFGGKAKGMFDPYSKQTTNNGCQVCIGFNHYRMSKSIDFGTEITGKIKESIKTKLSELGSYIDEELPDYIMIMIANRKSKAQMIDDLQLFLSNNTDNFVTWLQDMLQEFEGQSAQQPSSDVKKTEKQPEKHDRHKSVETVSSKTRSDSNDSGNNGRLELEVKGGEEDNLGVEKSDESSHHHHHHHHHHHKRRESSSVFIEEEEQKTETKTTTRRRAVEQVPASRRSRSRSPRRRSSGSRSHSPRGGPASHYSKRVMAAVLGNRREERSTRATVRESASRRHGLERRKSRTTPSEHGSSENDEEKGNETAPSSSVRVAPRKPGVSSALQPTTSLLMRAIAEAKSSIEGVPQSEIKVPPNSTIAATKADRDENESDDAEDIREILKRERRRGGIRGELERPGDRAIKSLRVLSTSDGGFISRSRQNRMKQEERKKIMSSLLQRQIEQEEREAKEVQVKEEETKKSDSENLGETEQPSPEKKQEEEEAVKEFNKNAAKDKTTKTVENVSTEPAVASNSTDVLMKALFHSSNDSNAIPLSPGKNNPQFIVTMEGIDESRMMGQILTSGSVGGYRAAKPPMSERLAPRPAQSLQSRLGPPVEGVTQTTELANPPESAPVQPEAGNKAEEVTPNNVDMEATARPPERCRFWPKCKAGDACVFAHPSQPCKLFPACRFGARCLYIHPDCKFDTACLNPDCPFTHRGNPPQPLATTTAATTPVSSATPATTTSSAATSHPPVSATTTTVQSSIPLCKFFPNCTNPFCVFSHPKPCRFGSSCYYKKTCTFWHSPSPVANAVASKLRWTAPSLSQTAQTSATTAALPASESSSNTEPPAAAATAVN